MIAGEEQNQTTVSPGYVVPDLEGAGCADLVILRVRAAALRRLAWLQFLWGGPMAPENWGWTLDDPDRPAAAMRWMAESEEALPFNETIAACEEALSGPVGATRQQIIQTFGLDEAERDLLDLALAVRMDSRVGEIISQINFPARDSEISDTMVSRLFGHTSRSIWRPGSPLAVWGLLFVSKMPNGRPVLSIDSRVQDWFNGVLGLDDVLIPMTRLAQPETPLPQWPVSETAQTLKPILENEGQARVIVSGLPGNGRGNFSAAVARALGTRLLLVDLTGFNEEEIPAGIFARVQRLALMGGFAIGWRGIGEKSWPRHIATTPLQFVLTGPGETLASHPDIADFFVDLPSPKQNEKQLMWHKLIPESRHWDSADMEALTLQNAVTLNDIASVARTRPATGGQALVQLKQRVKGRLESVGRLIDTPYGWNDLILPGAKIDVLKDISYEAATRLSISRKATTSRHLGKNGLAVLFHGTPGTGKTMGAQVLARELGADLVVVDVASTLSKWIGGTARNLRRLFSCVNGSGAAIFFDEADSLFVKRTEIRDSHDKHSNTDTNYLLQLIDNFDGICILATNRKNNIDPAFIRRMRFVVEFTRPGPMEQRSLWNLYITAFADAGRAAALKDLIEDMSNLVELSPAQIKSAVLTANYAALRLDKPMDSDTLVLGIKRELAKEGRSMEKRQQERLIKHG